LGPEREEELAYPAYLTGGGAMRAARGSRGSGKAAEDADWLAVSLAVLLVLLLGGWGWLEVGGGLDPGSGDAEPS